MAKNKMIGLQKYYVIPDDYGYEIDIKATPAIEYFVATADRRGELLERVIDWRKIKSLERWDVLWLDIKKELGDAT